MDQMKATRAMNGTFGEVWFDDEYLAEIVSFKATVDLKYDGVKRVGKLIEGKKLTSAEGKGDIKMTHIRTNVAAKVSEAVKAGKTPSFKTIGKIDDPDAIGAERVALYDCKPDKILLMDFEAGKVGEESYGFTFEDFEFLDKVIG